LPAEFGRVMGERSLLEQAISDDVGSGDAVKTISIRVLMAVVAIAALAMAMGVMVKRSNEFRALAEDQAESEQMSLAYADEGKGETGDPQRVARGEQMAAYHQKLRINTNGPLVIRGWRSSLTRRCPTRRHQYAKTDCRLDLFLTPVRRMARGDDCRPVSFDFEN
jgi:hypothetical protein